MPIRESESTEGQAQPPQTDMGEQLPQLKKRRWWVQEHPILATGVAIGLTIAGYLGYRAWTGTGADMTRQTAVQKAESQAGQALAGAENTFKQARAVTDKVAGRWDIKDLGTFIVDRNRDGTYTGRNTTGTTIHGNFDERTSEYTFVWNGKNPLRTGDIRFVMPGTQFKMKVEGDRMEGTYTSQRAGKTAESRTSGLRSVGTTDVNSRYTEAINAYHDVIKKFPNTAEAAQATEGIGDAYHEWGKALGNKSLLDEAITWHQQHLDLLKGKNAKHPDIPIALNNLAYDYLERNNPGTPAAGKTPAVESDLMRAKAFFQDSYDLDKNPDALAGRTRVLERLSGARPAAPAAPSTTAPRGATTTAPASPGTATPVAPATTTPPASTVTPPTAAAPATTTPPAPTTVTPPAPTTVTPPAAAPARAVAPAPAVAPATAATAAESLAAAEGKLGEARVAGERIVGRWQISEIGTITVEKGADGGYKVKSPDGSITGTYSPDEKKLDLTVKVEKIRRTSKGAWIVPGELPVTLTLEGDKLEGSYTARTSKSVRGNDVETKVGGTRLGAATEPSRKYAEAIKAFQDVAAKNPNTPEAASALRGIGDAYAEWAGAARNPGLLDDAIKYHRLHVDALKKANAGDPQIPAALNTLARDHMARNKPGDIDASKKLYDQSYDIDQNPEALEAKKKIEQIEQSRPARPATQPSTPTTQPAPSAPTTAPATTAPVAKPAAPAVTAPTPAQTLAAAEGKLSEARTSGDAVSGTWELQDLGTVTLQRNRDGTYSGKDSSGNAVDGKYSGQSKELKLTWHGKTQIRNGQGTYIMPETQFTFHIEEGKAEGSYKSKSGKAQQGGTLRDAAISGAKTPVDVSQKYIDAIAALQETAAKHPDTPEAARARQETGDAYREWAGASGNKSLLEEAVKYHQEHLDGLKAKNPKDPRIPKAMNELARDRMEMGGEKDLNAARELYDQSFQADRNPEALDGRTRADQLLNPPKAQPTTQPAAPATQPAGPTTAPAQPTANPAAPATQPAGQATVTPEAQSLAEANAMFNEAREASGIEGKWNGGARFGAMTLKRNADGTYSGNYDNGKEAGNIENGMYDEKTGRLIFTYHSGKNRGRAELAFRTDDNGVQRLGGTDLETLGGTTTETRRVYVPGQMRRSRYGYYRTPGHEVEKTIRIQDKQVSQAVSGTRMEEDARTMETKFEETVKAYQKVAKDHPGTEEAREAIEGVGDTYYEWARKTKNKSYLDLAIRYHTEYLDSLRRVDEKHQAIPTALHDIAEDHALRGKQDDKDIAIGLFREAFQLSGNPESFRRARELGWRGEE